MARGEILSRLRGRILPGIVLFVFISDRLERQVFAETCTPQQLARLVAPDAAIGDALGDAVAVSGDTFVVGARWKARPDLFLPRAGAAYVFVRSNGVWSFQAKLLAGDPGAHDEFGRALTISGDTIVIGAPLDDYGAVIDGGSVYAFVRSGETWSQEAKLISFYPQSGSQFGSAVSYTGYTLLVGAPRENFETLLRIGAVHAFSRNNGIWNTSGYLTTNSTINDAQLGTSCVLIDNTTAFLGAPGARPQSLTTGAAYFFKKMHHPVFGFTWLEQATLSGSDAAAQDLEGSAMAATEDTVLVGAHFDDHGGLVNAGSVYVFVRDGEAWTEQARLIPSDAHSWSLFGSSVAISGDTALIGAPGTSAAYLFVRENGVWTEAATLTTEIRSNLLGTAVALAGSQAIVTAPEEDTPPLSNHGAVFVFDIAECLPQADTDGDGVADSSDVCPANAPNLPVDCTGRPRRDANLDCLVNVDDIPALADEFLGVSAFATDCNNVPLRDTNGDSVVDAADLQNIVAELLD